MGVFCKTKDIRHEFHRLTLKGKLRSKAKERKKALDAPACRTGRDIRTLQTNRRAGINAVVKDKDKDKEKTKGGFHTKSQRAQRIKTSRPRRPSEYLQGPTPSGMEETGESERKAKYK